MSDTDPIAYRLAARVRILDLIDRRREIEGDMGIAAAIERHILSRELADLEVDGESCVLDRDSSAVTHRFKSRPGRDRVRTAGGET
jgi:hypothetical protein